MGTRDSIFPERVKPGQGKIEWLTTVKHQVVEIISGFGIYSKEYLEMRVFVFEDDRRSVGLDWVNSMCIMFGDCFHHQMNFTHWAVFIGSAFMEFVSEVCACVMCSCSAWR